MGQQCLVKAQELRLKAIQNSKVPKNDPESTIQLPKEVMDEVRLLQMDAVAILTIGNRFFAAALSHKDKHELLGKLTAEAAKRLHNILQVVLGFAMRHMCAPCAFRFVFPTCMLQWSNILQPAALSASSGTHLRLYGSREVL